MKLAIIALLLFVNSCSSFHIVSFPTERRPRLDDTSTASKSMWLFTGDWEEKVKGKLRMGEEVMIVYNATRLPYRSFLHGKRAWDNYVEYKFNNGGKVHKEKLDGPVLGIMKKSLFLPYGSSSITVWFKNQAFDNCFHYDSDYGKNYGEGVSVPKEATILFESDWSENVYGKLVTGHRFVVMYSPKRLPEGNGVTAVAKFAENSEKLHSQKLADAEHGFMTTTYDIPEDAEKVIMWFYTEVKGEKHYDSNNSKNYKFSVEKAKKASAK